MLGLHRLRHWNEVFLTHNEEAAESISGDNPDDDGVYLRCLHHIGNLEATCRTPGCRGDILRDITRTFPTHPYFALPSCLSGKEWNNTILPKTHGVEMLRHVLLALATARPDIGYCQGMNFVVGVLLLVGSLNSNLKSFNETNQDIHTLIGQLLDAAIPSDDEGPENENEANDRDSTGNHIHSAAITTITHQLSLLTEESSLAVETMVFHLMLRIIGGIQGSNNNNNNNNNKSNRTTTTTNNTINTTRQNHNPLAITSMAINYHHPRSNMMMWGMWQPNVPKMKLRVYQFDRILRYVLPDLHTHFQAIELTPEILVAQWFGTLFAYTLPLSMVTRVWDYIFSVGWVGMFSFAMALLSDQRQAILICEMSGVSTMLRSWKLKESEEEGIAGNGEKGDGERREDGEKSPSASSSAASSSYSSSSSTSSSSSSSSSSSPSSLSSTPFDALDRVLQLAKTSFTSSINDVLLAQLEQEFALEILSFSCKGPGPLSPPLLSENNNSISNKYHSHNNSGENSPSVSSGLGSASAFSALFLGIQTTTSNSNNNISSSGSWSNSSSGSGSSRNLFGGSSGGGGSSPLALSSLGGVGGGGGGGEWLARYGPSPRSFSQKVHGGRSKRTDTSNNSGNGNGDGGDDNSPSSLDSNSGQGDVDKCEDSCGGGGKGGVIDTISRKSNSSSGENGCTTGQSLQKAGNEGIVDDSIGGNGSGGSGSGSGSGLEDLRVVQWALDANHILMESDKEAIHGRIQRACHEWRLAIKEREEAEVAYESCCMTLVDLNKLFEQEMQIAHRLIDLAISGQSHDKNDKDNNDDNSNDNSNLIPHNTTNKVIHGNSGDNKDIPINPQSNPQSKSLSNSQSTRPSNRQSNSRSSSQSNSQSNVDSDRDDLVAFIADFHSNDDGDVDFDPDMDSDSDNDENSGRKDDREGVIPIQDNHVNQNHNQNHDHNRNPQDNNNEGVNQSQNGTNVTIVENGSTACVTSPAPLAITTTSNPHVHRQHQRAWRLFLTATSEDIYPGHGQGNNDDNVDDISSNNTYRTAHDTVGDGHVDGHVSGNVDGSDNISVNRSITSSTYTGTTTTTTDNVHTKNDSDNSSSGVGTQSGFGSMDLAAAFGRFFGAAGGGPLNPQSVKTRLQAHGFIDEEESEAPMSPLSPLSPPPITRGTSSSTHRTEENNSPTHVQPLIQVANHAHNNTNNHVSNNAPVTGNTNNSSSSSGSSSSDVLAKISSFFNQIVGTQSNLTITMHSNPLAVQSNTPVKNDSLVTGQGLLQEQNRYNHKTKKWETDDMDIAVNSRHCQQRVISLQRSIRLAKQAVGEAAQRLADAQILEEESYLYKNALCEQFQRLNERAQQERREILRTVAHNYE